MRIFLFFILLICVSSEAAETVRTPMPQELLRESPEAREPERQIAESMAEYATRPRKRFVSLNSKPPYRDYVASVARRIENLVNSNYPPELKGIHGTVTVVIEIQPDGQLRNVTIARSSGFEILDKAAVGLTQKAAPFSPFGDEFKEQIDFLDVVFPFKFTTAVPTPNL